MKSNLPRKDTDRQDCIPHHLIFLSCLLIIFILFANHGFGQSNTCADATPLSISPFGECATYAVDGTNAGATDTQGGPTCDIFYGPWPDVFYTFNSGPHVNLNLTLTAGTMTDIIVEITEGCGGSSIFCSAGFSSEFFAVDPYTDYVIRISSNEHFGDPGTFTICLTPPESPECSNPELTIVEYVYGENIPIEGCIPLDSAYSIVVFIPADNGNTHYLLTFDGDGPYLLDASQNGFGIGPFVGAVEITATGVENNTCSTTEYFVPELCVPNNSECSDAVVIPIDGTHIRGHNIGATPTPGYYGCGPAGFTYIQHSVWYKFVAPATGKIIIETFAGTLSDTQLWLYDGCGGNIVACDHDDGVNFLSKITLECNALIPGQMYYLLVDGWEGLTGIFDVSVSTEACPAPDNDLCANAVPLTVQAQNNCAGNAVTGSTSGATSDNISPGCESTNPDVFYSFNSGENSSVLVNIDYSPFEAMVMTVFAESCSGEIVSCFDNLAATSVVEVTPYTDYIVRISTNFGWGTTSPFNICIEEGYDCFDLQENIGSSCDDGNPYTTNDVITADCTCEGAPNGFGSLSGTIDGWNSGCLDRDLILHLTNFNTGNNYINLSGTLHPDGNFTLNSSTEIVPGTYSVLVKVDGALSKRIDGVEINSGSNTVVIPAILLGDINNDNVINISDISQFATGFGSASGDANYNPLSDFNCDGIINIVDVYTIGNKFGQAGDVILP